MKGKSCKLFDNTLKIGWAKGEITLLAEENEKVLPITETYSLD